MRNVAHQFRPALFSAFAIFAILAALVGAKAAWSALNFGGDDLPITTVVGAVHWDAGACFASLDGTPAGCSPLARDFLVDVHGLGISGPATGTLLGGTNGDLRFSSVRITCMTIAGNRAVIGGYVTVDNINPQFVGVPALFYLIDNGGPGNNAPFDKTGSRLVYPPGDDAGLPVGFPRNCGPPVIPAGFGYTDVHSGDISIHKGL